ncbi:hypothetical protein L1987_28330 [Smallanthus sonchifolius]|uniref:Uncharacterized protein n=1 Tax=Smallanthus sonchifolius TaxID=185202 RepID=A0ACB9ID09_9ASTR|nr:hypothetical protein L1987_28330 [Smallanthus sonchifolius]
MSTVGCSGENTHLSNIGAGNATRGSLVCTAWDCIMPNHMRIHDKDTQPHIIYILVYTMGVQSTTNYRKERVTKWTGWVMVIMLTFFFCRWLMEFFKSGLYMRCEACMPLSSTGLGRGVGTQSTLGTTKSRCECMLFTSNWSNATVLLVGIGLAQLCLSGRMGLWVGTPCTHYTSDFKRWVRFANLTGIEKGKDGISSPCARSSRYGDGIYGFCRSEPPDSNTDGKFWQSEDSEDEGSNDDRGTELLRRRSRQKGRDKPSNYLDGTMETAMRRYGLRSAGTYAGKINQSSIDVTPSMQKRGKEPGKESRHITGKENFLDCMNQIAVLKSDLKDNTGNDPMMAGTDSSPPMQEINHTFGAGLDVTMQNSESLHGTIEKGMIDNGGSNMEIMESGLLERDVMMNMEYAGDSILNGLSCGDSREEDQKVEEEGDSEVNSNLSIRASDNSRMEMMEEATTCPKTVMEKTHIGATNHKADWEAILWEPAEILWPEVWHDSTGLDEENVAWKETITSVKAIWAKWDHSKLIVECLAKWGNTPAFKDHAAWRKIHTSTVEKLLRLEVEKNACPDEEYLQRKKGKKHKRGGKFKHGKILQVDGAAGDGNMATGERIGNRLSTKMGTTKDSNARMAGKSINLKSKAIWNIYNELATRESRLKEIVSNIIKTDDNTMLVTSILNMSKQRVTKFSAKVNEHGGVSIDENMIENEDASVKEDLVVGNTTGISYANMLTGVSDKKEMRNKTTGVRYGSDPKGKVQVIQNKNVSVHQRNIVKRTGPDTIAALNNGAGNGMQDNQPKLNETQDKEQTGQNSENGIGGMHLDAMEFDPGNSVKAIHNKPRNSSTSVVETANRFILLDDEGNELDEGATVNVQESKEEGMDSNMNAGWIKKQDRILNTQYNERVNQSQRFEAKKYVQERLVPLSNILSSWSTSQKEYFRLLCNLHDFGDGYRAAAWDQPLSTSSDQVIIIDSGEVMTEAEPAKECLSDPMLLDKGHPPINPNVEIQEDEKAPGPDGYTARWLMEFFKSGLYMRCEACMPLSSTGLGRGVGTQSTLGTTKSRCECMLFTSNWSNATVLLVGIGLAQLCLSGRMGLWVGTPCTHYTSDFKSWDRRMRPQVGKFFREKSKWIQREKRIRNKSRNRNSTGTQNASTRKCSSAQPNKSGKLVSAQHYQQKSPLPPAPRNDVSVIHTSNPFDVLDEDMLDANKSAGADPDEEALGVGEKFYELSSDSIAKVLNFNPSKLTVPRIHDLPHVQDDPDFMDEMCEEEIPDFNITNAQKQGICNSLTRFGAVKADDQANWEQGEWEFFHYQMKILNIDPETSIEDVDSDSNETAQFFKSQMQQGAPGSQNQGVQGVIEGWFALESIHPMESAHKETKKASRRGSMTDPPDPGVDGKFWDVEEGSDEGMSGDEKVTTKIGLSRRNGNRKGKSKPSHSLDVSMESALRRYSLRSEDSGVLGISKPHA